MQVLGPLALAEARARPNGVRRLERLAPGRLPLLVATVARLDPVDIGRALEAAVLAYRELRNSQSPTGLVQRSAAEEAAVGFLRSRRSDPHGTF